MTMELAETLGKQVAENVRVRCRHRAQELWSPSSASPTREQRRRDHRRFPRNK